METPRTISRGASPDGMLRRAVSLDPAAALALLDSSREGLSIDEAAARLRGNGPNMLPVPHGPSLARLFADQLVHFFALVLWAAAVLAFIGDLPQLGIAIVLVIVINGVFSFLQEYRAERAVRALA